MHITVYCPSCRSRYQLDPSLRGQRMRCPNPVCREIFEVQEAEPEALKPAETAGEPAAPPPDVEPSPVPRQHPHREESASGTVRTIGSVGDLVPILDAEVVHEVPAPVDTSTSAPPDREVHEAMPIRPEHDEDVKPIPVDFDVPPPIDVENLVPLEPGEEERPKPVQEVTSWHVPPPVRNPNATTGSSQLPERVSSPPPEPADRPTAQPPRTSQSRRTTRSSPTMRARVPAEAPPTWQTTPPVRRRGEDLSAEPPRPGAALPEVVGPEAFAPEPTYDAGSASSKASRRALWVIVAMVIVAGFLIASVTVMTLNAYVRTEANLGARAKAEYDQGKYASAANAYENLLKDFPNSEHRSLYELLAELSQVREQVYSAQVDPDRARDAMQGFLKRHQSEPLVKTYKPDIGQTLRKLAEQITALAEQEHDQALLDKAKETLAQSVNYLPEQSDTHALHEKIARAALAIAQHHNKRDLLARLTQWQQNKPSVEMVRNARRLARKIGLDQDTDVRAGITKIESQLGLAVRYVQDTAGSAKAAPDVIETSLLIVPPLSSPVNSPAKVSRENKKAVLALARGVLYALDQRTGEELWATRVGIDTAMLPVHLAATEAAPALLLVLSADRDTVMALEPHNGSLFWQRRLTAPCLGRPAIVGRRAFVPTYDGRVYEMETAQGNVLGYFDLGQRLTVGGVPEEGTNRLYFPGDSDYLYVLDAAAKKCVAILHTGHPSGSLRSEPLLVHRSDPFAKPGEATTIPSYLILAQAEGLTQMKLRVFGLPIDNAEAPPLLRPEPLVRGWSWFQPYHDGERLAFVTDAGVFGLFGIKQVHNDDPELFPELLQQKPVRTNARLTRGQVVHVVENDFWVLADGKLERLHFDLFKQRTLAVWKTPLPLGSPVHASQVEDDEKTLFVVTQDATRQIYLATAVNAEDGTIQWQRQLGLECQGDPIVLGQEVITVDRGGGLCIVDGSNYRHQANREWRRADPLYAAPLQGGPITAYLLPGPEGDSVYEVACSTPDARSTQSATLVVRRHQTGQLGDKPEEPKVELRSPLAGTPAIVGQSLLVPLADGAVRRFPLPLTRGAGEGGPDWRAGRADEEARGHIVALNAEEFLTTDGGRGLTHWHWPLKGDATFQTVPGNGPVPTVQLPAPIVSAPVVLPSGTANADWQVCVADEEGNLALLRGPDLKATHTWPLHGKITAGPFRRGPYLGCVVDRHRLVWIDPSKADILWEYPSQGQGIVGEPQLVGDLVVVADLSGRFVGLDPTNGKARGPGYALKANVAPAATPVRYGADAAFVPLSDGTVFVLALRHLRDPLAALPVVGR